MSLLKEQLWPMHQLLVGTLFCVSNVIKFVFPGVVACSAITLLSLGHGLYLGYKLGMMVRIATTAAIYQKVDVLCTIALSVIAQISAGFGAETSVTEQTFYWSRDKPGLK